ncbi:unnamed protein product, partial [Meganyctiphanes norvegica]
GENPTALPSAAKKSFPNFTCDEKKMNNEYESKNSANVSCEDNSQVGLKPERHYDFTKEYLEKVDAKRREAEAHAAASYSGGTTSLSNIEKEPSQQMAAAAVQMPGNTETHSLQNKKNSEESPESQRGQHLGPNSTPVERFRRPSNSSDTSYVSECNVPLISYKELEEATSSWNSDNLLGRGGFGAVYKGCWKHTQVAIKRIEP